MQYLESSAQTEDTVVGFLWSETLQGGLNYVVLLGEQVIGPASQIPSAHHSTIGHIPHCLLLYSCIHRVRIGAPYLRPSCL